MLKYLLSFGFILFCAIHQAAASGGVGLNLGLGLPYVTQGGVNFKISDYFGFSIGYNVLSIGGSGANVKLSMPEALVHIHPFGGSFFIAGGVGSETLKVTAQDSTTGSTAQIDVKASTTVAKLGWMWGLSDGGFWFGLDASYISPSSPKQTITANGVPVTSSAYQDAVGAADKFGKTSYANITFARFGWLF